MYGHSKLYTNLKIAAYTMPYLRMYKQGYFTPFYTDFYFKMIAFNFRECNSSQVILVCLRVKV